MGRKFNLLASTALTTSTAFVSGALAADMRMAVKAPPPVAPPPFSWNGCYAGLNAGVVFGRVGQQIDIPGVVVVDSGSRNSGFTGGAQIGCNFLYSPNLLVGIEGDVNFADINRNRNFAFTFSGEDTVGSQSSKLQWLSTVRGRLGYAWDRSLLYATGGLAIGTVKSSISAVSDSSGVYAGPGTDTRLGWAVGAGYEYAFTQSVSAKLEYLHFDLGRTSYAVFQIVNGGNLPSTWNASAKVSGDIVRLGVNVKLNQ